VELVPAAGAEVPAIGPSVEVPAGAAQAPTGATEVPPALEEEEARFLQLEVSSISPRTPLISRGCRSLLYRFVDRVTPIVPSLVLPRRLGLERPRRQGGVPRGCREQRRAWRRRASRRASRLRSRGRIKRGRRQHRRKRGSPAPLPKAQAGSSGEPAYRGPRGDEGRCQ
jgi:hypothetical protein